MLRSIGSVTFLALFMAGCGGGGGGNGTTYSIGGTVTGLTGSGLVLQTNAGDVVAVSGPGEFTFANQVGSGAAYTVFVKTQPSSPTQNCVVGNGTGIVRTANVTTVAVACSTGTGQYTGGGTVSGLVGSGLVLQLFAPQYKGSKLAYAVSDPLQINSNGPFAFNITYLELYLQMQPYVFIRIEQQPSSPPQNCVISKAAVSSQAANDTGFAVACANILEYSYVTNAADNTVSSYRIDATAGAVAVIGAPAVTGQSPYAIVGTSGLGFLFVANQGSNDISAFAVDPATGSLTAVPGSPFPAGTDPQSMALSFVQLNDDYILYVANAGSDNVSAYFIDPNTGALGAPTTIATAKSPTSITVLPNYGFVYVANHGGSNDISAFTTSQSALPDGSMLINLTPVPGSPFPAGGNPLGLALGAGGKFLYTANPDASNPSISGLSIDQTTGTLSPLSGSPFPLPVSHYMATDQTGTYLYVTSGANIVAYAIDATTGALTPLPGFPVAAGANANSITIDPTNHILYVTNDGAATVSGFTLDASTGALTPMATSPFPAGHHPAFIAAF